MADSIFIWPGASGGQFTGQSIGPAADNTAAPPFTFLGDLTTGYASSATGTLSLVTAGTTRLSLNSTGATFAANVIGAFSRTALATTSTDGLTLTNSTAATGGATVQISPRFRLRGNAWDTAASETVDFFMENLPATAATPTGTLKFGYSLNGAAATYPMTLTSAGVLTTTSSNNGLPPYIGVSAGGRYFYGRQAADTLGRIGFEDDGTNGLLFLSTNGTGRQIQMSPTADGKLKTTGSSTSLGYVADANTDSTLTLFARDGTSAGALAVSGGSGGLFSAVKSLSELTTIAAAASTDTTIQMPANSVVLGVSVRVTTVIPTATNFTVGDSGSAARFSTAAVSTAATSTDPGTKAGAYYNASALSVRITPDLTPAANTGRVRVTIYYYSVTPPTS